MKNYNKSSIISLLSVLLLSIQVYATPKDCRKVVTFQELEILRSHSKVAFDPTVQANALIQLIESNYGPLTMKPSSVGINWKTMKEKLIKDVSQAESTNDLHFIYNQFFAQVNDGHVSNPIPSSLSLQIPVEFVAVEGKLLIAGHDEDQFPKTQRVPQKGDEVTQINGLSVVDFQKQFSAWNSSGNPQTNYSTFAIGLTRWSESSGIPVSQLNLNEIVLTMETITGETYNLRFEIKKEGIGLIGRDIDLKDPAPAIVQEKENQKSNNLDLALGLRKQNEGTHRILNLIEKLFNTMVSHNSILSSKPISQNSSRMVLGLPTPFFKLPEDFKPIQFPFFGATKKMLGGDVFTAGTFQRNGKTIGFLRIGSYSISNFMGMELSIRRIIGQLNSLTDTLIIDQTNNPGGYVVFADLLIRSLSGKFDESKHMKFAVKPTQDFLRQYAETLQEVKRNRDGKLTEEQVKYFSTKIEAEYNKIYQAYIEGRNLTEPVSMLIFSEYMALTLGDHLISHPLIKFVAKQLLGEHVLTPQVFKGTKKLLCNELCFSGGDAFPALFQDYNIGDTYGLNTAGAGGTVIPFQIDGYIPLQGSITNSLMVRYDGALVENYGVKPKYNLSIRREDVVNGYDNFFEFALQKMGL